MTVTFVRTDAALVAARLGLPRVAIVLALAAGAAAGVALGAHEAPVMDADLLRLLRAMAILKIAFVALAAGAVLWRLQAPVRPVWLAAYVCCCSAMAAGPSLIWFSSHIVLAAILLHAGLASTLVLLWREGAAAEMIRAVVARRRVVSLG